MKAALIAALLAAAPAYSAPQAVRGRAIYAAHCAACHGESLAGGEAAPPLTGPQFAETWGGQSAKALFDRIALMPPTAPESLTRQQRADVLAYLMQAAGQASGPAELSSRGADLEAIVLELSPRP